MMLTFTSESVSPGHPDKIADQISDAILDEYISADANSRTAIETMVTTDNVIVAGEVKGPDSIHKKVEDIVRSTIRDIGYNTDHFHWEEVKVTNLLHQQSPEIAYGVDKKGAGDQGLMFGYATNETESLMPAPIYYAHKVLQNILQSVAVGKIPQLGPDAKSQVTLLYQNQMPVAVTNLVVSIQHPEDMSQQNVYDAIYDVVQNTFPAGWMCDHKNFLVNPSGKFTIGGPVSDCGVTGRKIIVDTYGGAAPHGGGAFSGKDPTKVDRSAAYVARYIAKNVVASGLASKCLVNLAYAIGVVDPLSFTIETDNTNIIDEKVILDYVRELIDLSPLGIRQLLKLDRPIYLPTATYGHFGRQSSNDQFCWEKADLGLSELRQKVGI